jgi:hypothetical protein
MGNPPDVRRRAAWDRGRMFSSDSYLIRAAQPADDSHLMRLSILDSKHPLSRPALIGEIEGVPAAAIELETERVVADPFASTIVLLAHMRVRAALLRPTERGRASVRDRLRRAARQARWA